jgi:hypothetical protein
LLALTNAHAGVMSALHNSQQRRQDDADRAAALMHLNVLASFTRQY